jgi:acyl carrier protein
MADTKQRLVHCMKAVFPSVSESTLEQARHTNLAGWDSVASVTLFATIEEEFGIEIDIQDMKNLLSFESLFEYLEGHSHQNGS